MSNLVWTQYGPVPRDVLEAKDEIAETEGARTFATSWFLTEPLTLKYWPIGTVHKEVPFVEVIRADGRRVATPFFFPDKKEIDVIVLDGSKKVIKEDDEVSLQVGEFMRRSCAAEMFMPSAIGAAQAQM
jgi:hypothetical protein